MRPRWGDICRFPRFLAEMQGGTEHALKDRSITPRRSRRHRPDATNEQFTQRRRCTDKSHRPIALSRRESRRERDGVRGCRQRPTVRFLHTLCPLKGETNVEWRMLNWRVDWPGGAPVRPPEDASRA